MKKMLLGNTSKCIAAIRAANALRNAVYIGVAAISVINIIKIYKAITD